MKRLFTDEDQIALEIGQLVRNGEPVDMVELYEAKETVDYVVESFKLVPNVLETATLVDTAMRGNNYLMTLEAYNPLLEQLKRNLGCTLSFPALEDYSNEYTAKTSRELALEGLNNIFKRIWETIRKFFAAFFKKVNEFTRRLMGANLQIDTYEKYVPDLLKKIRNDKLTPDNIKKEVDSKLSSLLAPDGIDKLNSTWVVNNSPMIISSIIRTHVYLFAQGLPELGKHFKNISNHLDELNGIKDIVDDGTAVLKLEQIKDDIRNEIRNVVTSICPNELQPKDLSEQAFDSLATISSSSNLKGLSIHSLSDNKNNYTRLPRDFNLVIGVSPEDKIYSVSNEETSNAKATTLEILSDLEALDRVYNEYKRLTKDFDIKTLSKKFDLANQEVNLFLDKAARSLGGIQDILEQGKTKKVNTGIQVSQIVQEGKHAILSSCVRLKELYEDLGRESEFNSSMSEFALIPTHEATDDILIKAIELIEQYYIKEPDVINRTKETGEYNMFKKAIDSYSSTGGTRGLSPTTIAGLNNETKELERMCVNLAQNIQIALSAVQVGFPKMVTELRYELLKYVYDSAKEFS